MAPKTVSIFLLWRYVNLNKSKIQHITAIGLYLTHSPQYAPYGAWLRHKKTVEPTVDSKQPLRAVLILNIPKILLFLFPTWGESCHKGEEFCFPW